MNWKDSSRSADKISRLSDMVYLAWKQTTPQGADYRNPKYYMAANINNPSTVDILKKIFANGKKDLEQYHEKGTPIHFDDKDGQALLGSPSGIAAAWLLINHRTDFKQKSMDNVRVFGDNDDREMLILVFEIIDLPPKTKKRSIAEDPIRVQSHGHQPKHGSRRRSDHDSSEDDTFGHAFDGHFKAESDDYSRDAWMENKY